MEAVRLFYTVVEWLCDISKIGNEMTVIRAQPWKLSRLRNSSRSWPCLNLDSIGSYPFFTDNVAKVLDLALEVVALFRGEFEPCFLYTLEDSAEIVYFECSFWYQDVIQVH